MTSLKMSKAKEFSDSINEACFNVTLILTGLSGKLSELFLQDIRNREKIADKTNPVFNILIFIMLGLMNVYYI
jgi:hypothetical protein